MKLIVKVDHNLNLLVKQTDKLLLQKTFKVDDILECQVKLDDKLRSTPENALYWQLMNYASRSMPEWFHRVTGMKNCTKEMMHEICKAKFEISSTAFMRMGENGFNVYFKSVQSWIAQYFFQTTSDDMMHEIMEEK